MGLVLLVVIWLITILSTYFFIAKTWWLPVGASAAAADIDHHFTITYILMGAVFVAAQFLRRFWLRARESDGCSTRPSSVARGPALATDLAPPVRSSSRTG